MIPPVFSVPSSNFLHYFVTGREYSQSSLDESPTNTKALPKRHLTGKLQEIKHTAVTSGLSVEITVSKLAKESNVHSVQFPSNIDVQYNYCLLGHMHGLAIG